MPAGQHNLTGDQKIEAGSTYDKTVPVVDLQGVDLDFTTNFVMDSAQMQLRLGVDSTGAALLTLDDITEVAADAGTTGLYITDGNVRIVISAADSTALSYDVGGDAPIEGNRIGFYHVEVYDTGTRTWRILEGQYEISPELVRP